MGIVRDPEEGERRIRRGKRAILAGSLILLASLLLTIATSSYSQEALISSEIFILKNVKAGEIIELGLGNFSNLTVGFTDPVNLYLDTACRPPTTLMFKEPQGPGITQECKSELSSVKILNFTKLNITPEGEVSELILSASLTVKYYPLMDALILLLIIALLGAALGILGVFMYISGKVILLGELNP